ncbi:hypothetical protein EUGRSUZ_L01755 [Eucalyptus grandis]|uniref:Uncharacterized protein n=1 Tax=Eucalyptus grandis TaxID=71139 RepID=A0A058ZUH0_EUCGR|nr:hypothetical protein EUGRSUZ_L01755 [Eucalyptus grandis]
MPASKTHDITSHIPKRESRSASQKREREKQTLPSSCKYRANSMTICNSKTNTIAGEVLKYRRAKRKTYSSSIFKEVTSSKLINKVQCSKMRWAKS